jgi:hypothetical protein
VSRMLLSSLGHLTLCRSDAEGRITYSARANAVKGRTPK